VGQLFALGLAGDRLGPAERTVIRTDHVGSVWFVARTTVGVVGVRRVADSVQLLATAATTGQVRFYVAANQEGGTIQSLTGPGFSRIPSAVDQGVISATTLRGDATRWGRQLAAAGVNLDFAPVLDVVPAGSESTNQPIGVLRREYGHSPAAVSEHGLAFLQGLQAAHVASTAKHFPGLGRVVGNTDVTADVVDHTTTPDDPYLQPFAAATAAHVPFVLVALATYERIDPHHLAVFSPLVIKGILRGRLQFHGVVMSDDLGATSAVAGISAGRRAVDFLLAGGDLVVSKTVPATQAMYRAVLARAGADPAFRALVDASVLRVLRAKQASGLLPCT
jgi:beta-N-acetylhexosaminidase